MRNFKLKLYSKLFGGLIIAVFLIRYSSNLENVDKSNLHQFNVELYTEIKIFKGSTHGYIYKFWSTDFPVEFVIHPNDLLSNNRSLVENLKKEDSITLFIKGKDIEKLIKKSKRVRVYQIVKNGMEYLKD
ncbi:hypothetical protein WNY78_16255 [Psychroserpens sp. AS72]|uniref:hypothetical protein n=1 Tax=Psychroserpens sp. AS72 TaxID=3135775 RepID=UPI00316E69D4